MQEKTNDLIASKDSYNEYVKNIEQKKLLDAKNLEEVSDHFLFFKLKIFFTQIFNFVFAHTGSLWIGSCKKMLINCESFVDKLRD